MVSLKYIYKVPYHLRAGLLFLSLCLTLVSCSSQNECTPGDGGSIDFLDAIRRQRTTYYLILRVTGFQDKAAYFELYNERPRFDTCGKPSIEPIQVEHYADFPAEQYIKKITFHVDREKYLEITYTSNEQGSINLYELVFSEE